MLTQLQNPIPLTTPKGKAWAIAIIDYGPHWDLQWVTFVHDTGECWTFTNSDVRQEKNFTFGLPSPSPIRPPAPRIHRENREHQENGVEHLATSAEEVVKLMRPAIPVASAPQRETHTF
jgi:hypothetical protein